MSLDSNRPLLDGSATSQSGKDTHIKTLNDGLKAAQSTDNALKLAKFHGDPLLADKIIKKSGLVADVRGVVTLQNVPALGSLAYSFLTSKLTGKSADVQAFAQIAGSLPNDSLARENTTRSEVMSKYDKMLHPPLTYLGDAFKYRQADGKYNSATHPHLGQAGAPYAKSVPSISYPLGALPDPGDIFDRLMARTEDRPSTSGLSSMLVYHATIIIHDIFRTNDKDKNISDTSSYLDLSPLYGFTEEMQRKVRDDKYKLGLLKPDTFAEDRLLRQPPGVCIMLVMYNRYHNYAATQLRRINENNRFSVPKKYGLSKSAALARNFVEQISIEEYKNYTEWLNLDQEDLVPTTTKAQINQFRNSLYKHSESWKQYEASGPITEPEERGSGADEDYRAYLDYQKLDERLEMYARNAKAGSLIAKEIDAEKYKTKKTTVSPEKRKSIIAQAKIDAEKALSDFKKEYDAAWDKLDNDLFNTARLITCGMYIQVSIHDYLRALMGFHQFDSTFTLDPRIADDHKNVSRGLGNQVTIEFNLLYRFHCAISGRDEKYTEDFLQEAKLGAGLNWPGRDGKPWDPKDITMEQFSELMRAGGKAPAKEPCDQEFGLHVDPKKKFARNKHTGLFDDQKMVEELIQSMDEPLANFGPRNVPRCLRPVEILGILQARKWEIGTLNDFRQFFQMKRHETFESITPNPDVQTALRDLYEHPDKVEFYPGVFCESSKDMNADPGPSGLDSALWTAIFSDAITLVRSDRFYTVDWNTNSLTSWGMKEVTPDNDNLKSSVFHRLLQRAFPEWFSYDSVRFFHPFYTSQQNALYAQAQGYDKTFKMESKIVTNEHNKSITTWDNPSKPLKPVYLSNIDDISAILTDKGESLVHPARLRLKDMPRQIREILEIKRDNSDVREQAVGANCSVKDEALREYFEKLSHDIIMREFIVMDKRNPEDPIYQIDVTRDFAIPVITRYVADFLGFADKVKSNDNPHAEYSENEIYQHITNCQIFFSYNSDETKLIRRRKAFTTSMTFLYELTRAGHIRDATLWGKMKGIFWRSKLNPMEQLGLEIAHQVLEKEPDHGRAAAILLLIGLDSAYHGVVAFTSVLGLFIKELYEVAEQHQHEPEAAANAKTSKESQWEALQKIAFDTTPNAYEIFSGFVYTAQKQSVRLPVVKKAVEDCKFVGANGRLINITKDATVVCDIYAAENPKPESSKTNGTHMKATSTNGSSNNDVSKTSIQTPLGIVRPPGSANETQYLAYQSSFTDQFAAQHPRHIAALSLTCMIKVLAQLKNLRRSPHTQGHLKKVQLDSSCEGYSNYMAPMRMKKIGHDVKKAREVANIALEAAVTTEEKTAAEKNLEYLDAIFNTDILKPAADTYLSPEWDELLPFPTTWKLRFNGFGDSNYGEGLNILWQTPVPDDQPPYYQPNGPSHVGGSFATWNSQDVEALPKLAANGIVKPSQAVSAGCQIPHPGA